MRSLWNTYLSDDATVWHEWWAWRPVILITGERIRWRTVMRRLTACHGWQYREPTFEEWGETQW